MRNLFLKSHFSAFNADWNCTVHFIHLLHFLKVAHMFLKSGDGFLGGNAGHINVDGGLGPNDIVLHRWHWHSCSWNPPFIVGLKFAPIIKNKIIFFLMYYEKITYFSSCLVILELEPSPASDCRLLKLDMCSKSRCSLSSRLIE